MNTIPQHSSGETGITIGNHNGRITTVQTSSPGRNGIVDGDDRVVVEGQGDDLVNLSRC